VSPNRPKKDKNKLKSALNNELSLDKRSSFENKVKQAEENPKLNTHAQQQGNPDDSQSKGISQNGKSGKSMVNSASASNNSMHNIANKNEVFLGGLPLNITTGKISLIFSKN
jgi:hypothetical protein